MNLKKYLVAQQATIFDCLKQLNELKTDLNLFVVNSENRLLGSVTDGDIRRGIIRGISLQDEVAKVMNPSCKFLVEGNIDLYMVREQRKNAIKILPIVNSENQITGILNFNKVQTLLPVDAVIMAGGSGTRLLPMTQEVPKPLL